MRRTLPLLALLLAAGPCLAQAPAAPTAPDATVPGSMAPGTMPSGPMTPGSMAPSSMAPGGMAPGTMPPGSMPAGSMPAGSMPHSAMPNGAMPHGAMPGMHASAPGADAPSSQAYRDAMMKMHQAMDIPYTGNADQDFVAGMLPHHQGAVDMAKVELRYGRDPALRRLAQDVVRAQEKEIAFMRQWQAKHPH